MVKSYEWNHLESPLPEGSNNVLCPITNIMTLLVRNYLWNCLFFIFFLQGLAKALFYNRTTSEERLETKLLLLLQNEGRGF